jgi:hypothetical protein
VRVFVPNASEVVKKVLGEFEEYQFFAGQSMNADAMIVLCRYKEDGMTPVFYFWKDGLTVEEK